MVKIRVTRGQAAQINAIALWLSRGYTLYRSPGLDKVRWWIGDATTLSVFRLSTRTMESLRYKKVIVRDVPRSYRNVWVYGINQQVKPPVVSGMVRVA